MRTREKQNSVIGSMRRPGLDNTRLQQIHHLITQDIYSTVHIPGQYFNSVETTREGSWNGRGFVNEYQNFIPDGILDLDPQLLEYDASYLTRMATRLAADVNPSSGPGGLDETFGELHDALNLTKFTATNALNTYGKAFLTTTFGWMPVLKDVYSIMAVVADIERMLEQLKRLRAGLSVSGTKRLQIETKELYGRKIVQSYGAWTEAELHEVRSLKGHVFARYRPTPGSVISFASEQELRVLAYALAKGLQFDISTAWNLVPWSWLIDWAFNVGDYLNAVRNSIGCELTELYASVQTETKIGITYLNVPTHLLGPYNNVVKRGKKRIPLKLDILPTWPIINSARLGTISALTASLVGNIANVGPRPLR